MSDDTTTYVETTTTTVERTVPEIESAAQLEVDPAMSQAILDRLDALDRRIDEMAPTVEINETTIEEPEEPLTEQPETDKPETEDDPSVSEPTNDPSEPLTPGEREHPVVDDPNERPDTVAAPGDTPPSVPDPEKPYADRPEIENDPYTPDASSGTKKRRKDRAPKTPRSWRTAILGGSGGIRTGGSK